MDTPNLAITTEGLVYRQREHGRPLLLGHISCLARETRLGREVRAWWQAGLASAPRLGGIWQFATFEIETTHRNAPQLVALITDNLRELGVLR